MKKLSIILAMAAVALGFSSCSEDRDPVYKAPTQFVLNTPAMQDQYIALTEGQTLELTCSQPDYGYSAVAQYAAQMSLTEDFAQVYDLNNINPTKTQISIRQEDIALGMCELSGIDSKETYDELWNGNPAPMKVYFRATAQLTGVESSAITSNVVSYNNIKPYFAVAVPGFIYLIGDCGGWTGPDAGNAATLAQWRLFEPDNAIGSKVYTGVFDIPAGKATFRFYTELTGWDGGASIGTQVEDDPIDYPEFTEGTFTGMAVKGKGSFQFSQWPGGKMTITVDMSDMNNIFVTIQAGEHSVTVTQYIYLVGSISGWMAPGLSNEAAYKEFRLADSEGTGIYTGSFAAPAGHCNFRFCQELTADDWDNATQFGAQVEDGDVACTFSNGAFSGTYVMGKGNYAFELDAEATLDIAVDINAHTVTVNLK